MTTDLDALIAELRACVERGSYSGGGYYYVEVSPEDAVAAADALESTLAELRQERERADKAERAADRQNAENATLVEEHVAALSRAEEAIEKVLAVPNEFEWDVPPTAKRILTEYGEQKERA